MYHIICPHMPSTFAFLSSPLTHLLGRVLDTAHPKIQTAPVE